MYDESELIMSSLNKILSIEGKTVEIFIYKNDEDGWILEVEDENKTSYVWNESFKTDELALKELMDTIEKEGITSLFEKQS